MISRRKFLELGATSAGVAAFATPLRPESQDAALPPSIAALKSRKDEATPITREERQQRQERARKLMTENSLDAIVLMEGTSLRYFTGIRWWGGERMFALVLPAKGKAFYVCPEFEEGRENRSRMRTKASIPTCVSGRKTRARTSAWLRDFRSEASPLGRSVSRRLFGLCLRRALGRPHRRRRSSALRQ